MAANRLLGLLPAVMVMACAAASGSLPGWEEPEGSGAGASPAAGGTDEEAEEEASEDDADNGEIEDSSTAESGEAAPAGEAAADAPVARAEDEGPGPLPKPLHPDVKASCGNDPGVGQRLKPFNLRTPDGKPINAGKYRGRVLLVNFWGTWCKPCLKELPEFDRIYRRYRKHGLTLVAIATDEDAAPIQDFVDRRKLAAKVAMGGESYAGQYGSDKFPFSFVVDHKGVIKSSFRGYKPECSGKIEADIRAALEQRNR